MDCESYNLNWDEFSSYTSNIFNQLLSSSEFKDVTLFCNGEETIDVHKVVLSACSPVFSRILRKTSEKHPLVYLTDVIYSDLQALVNFIYLGQTTVVQKDLKRFLSVAAKFEVRGLTDNKYQDDKNSRELSCTPIESIETKSDIKDKTTGIELSMNIGDDEDINKSIETEEDFNLKSEIHCDGENMFFDNSGDVQNHENSYLLQNYSYTKSENEKLYPCDQCDYKATYACNLTSHKRTVHDKLYLYCEFCEFKSSRKDRLNKHVISKHSH